MTIDPERALSAALIAALRADAGLAPLLAGRVYDEPPPDPVYPYLHVGRMQSRPWGGASGADEAEGVETVVTLTCVSRFGGVEEAKAVNGAVRACLHDAAPTLVDSRVVTPALHLRRRVPRRRLALDLRRRAAARGDRTPPTDPRSLTDMAAQKGKDILLKIGDASTPPVFTTVAGVRARTLSLNAKSVDVTDSDSPGWRELLAGGGRASCVSARSRAPACSRTRRPTRRSARASSTSPPSPGSWWSRASA